MAVVLPDRGLPYAVRGLGAGVDHPSGDIAAGEDEVLALSRA
jgi:hypothetical protein